MSGVKFYIRPYSPVDNYFKWEYVYKQFQNLVENNAYWFGIHIIQYSTETYYVVHITDTLNYEFKKVQC